MIHISQEELVHHNSSKGMSKVYKVAIIGKIINDNQDAVISTHGRQTFDKF